MFQRNNGNQIDQLAGEIIRIEREQESLSAKSLENIGKLKILKQAQVVLRGEMPSEDAPAGPLRSHSAPEVQAGTLAKFNVSSILNLGRREAMTAMAKFCGGVVDSREAAPLLVKAGLSQQKRSESDAYSACASSKTFRRVKPCVFELIG